MGLAKHTAHATTATITAIVDAQSEDCLTGIPANYFENRAEQLEEAAAKLSDEKAERVAVLDAEKNEKLAELKAQRAKLMAKLDEEMAQVKADAAAEKKQVVAEIEEERTQLEEKAADFRHQAARYDHNKRRCSYLDCLRGKASVPKERAGMLLFQALMIGGMVSIMTSFNGYRHSGVDFFVNYHWMYPLTFCITFLIREWFMNDFTEAIIHQYILPKFQGVKKATLITLLNIVCMVPLMSTIMTMMLYGFHNLGATLLEQVPITIVVGACVNFFIVSPIVKMIYNNIIVANRQGETGFYNRFREMIMPWLAAFNS